MKREKIVCLKCNKQISKSNYKRHFDSCEEKEKDWFINDKNKYVCKICGKISTKYGIGNHVKYHYGYKNPRSKDRGAIAWNKGLTKETSESIRKSVDTFQRRILEGKIRPSFLGKKHSEETRKKWKENPNMGGLRKGSGRGKKGWYKGFYCRSTWELAWLVYQLDQEVKVSHCHDTFEYEFEGEKHKYYPDFIVDGVYIEIKGFRYPNTQSKIDQFPGDKKLVLIEGKKYIKPYLSYVEGKYGKEFWSKLYEC